MLMASLVVTHNCNLRCSYCFAGEKKRESMNPQVLDQSLSFLLQQYWEALTINFFGGEPFLEYDLIRYCLERMNQYSSQGRLQGKRYGYTITTNGTILDREKYEFIRNNNFAVTLSIDGYQQRQDICRRTTGGKGSWTAFEKNLDYWLALARQDLVSIRMTVTPDNVQGLTDDIARFLKDGFPSVVYSPDYSANWDEESLQVLEEEIIKTGEIYCQAYQSNHQVRLAVVDKYIKSLNSKKTRSCEAGKGRLAIAPSGNIYPCHRFVGEDDDNRIQIGTVYEGIDTGAYFYQNLRSSKGDEGCDKCAHYIRCGNICPAVNYQTNQDLSQRNCVCCQVEQFSIPVADKVFTTLYQEKNNSFMQKYFPNLNQPKGDQNEAITL